MNKTDFDVVLIGNYTKDTEVTPSGTRYADGGGFNYGAHVAAMMGLKIAAITRLAREDNHVVHALEQLGVEVFPYYSPRSTVMRLYYPTTDMDKRVLTVTSEADPFTPDQVMDIEAKVFLLNGSVRGEITLEVIRELRKKEARITADLQGFIRVVSQDGTLEYRSDWPEKHDILPQIDILKGDVVEGESLTGEKDIRIQAKKLAEYGPEEIVLTHQNGVLVYAANNYHEAEFTSKKIVGRSGRGDTCISSYVCKRMTSSPEESTIWAAAVTSLKMEAVGPIKRDIHEVEERIKNNY